MADTFYVVGAVAGDDDLAVGLDRDRGRAARLPDRERLLAVPAKPGSSDPSGVYLASANFAW